MMFNKIVSVLKGSKIEEIYFTGCFDSEDNDFIINANYIYFELGSQFVCFEAIENYSKIKIHITPTILYQNEVEDMIDGKVKVSELIFTNPLSSNREIASVSFINLEKYATNITCEVLSFELINGEYVFLDPSFLGIKIGSFQQQEFWKNNKNSQKIFSEEKIDFM